MEELFEAKRLWHEMRAELRIREKFRILLQMHADRALFDHLESRPEFGSIKARGLPPRRVAARPHFCRL